MKKRKKRMLMGISLLLLGFFFVPSLRSEMVMRPASFLAYRDSVMREKEFHLILPDGSNTWEEDWTPSIKIYHSRAFESAKKPVSATILYNFAAFSDGRSRLYDSESPYEMAYYGAYAVSREEDGGRSFGFDDEGNIDREEMAIIPLYDLEVLVLRGLGCPKELAKTEIASIEEIKPESDRFQGWVIPPDGDLVQYGWTRLDVQIETRSLVHSRIAWNQNDLQYGPPPEDVEEDFPPLILKGRIYAKAYPEWGTTIFLYVFAKDEEIIEGTDKNFLQKVRIYGRDIWVP